MRSLIDLKRFISILLSVLLATITMITFVGCFGDPVDTSAHDHVWTDATCTSPKRCIVCSATEGDALGHTWVEEEGTEIRKCSVCQATETLDGEHVHNLIESVIEPTCTEGGYTLRVCSCGVAFKSNETDPLGHAWVDVDATTVKCSVCGTTETAGMGDHEHIYKSDVTAPTCTEAGYTTYTCACGDTYKGDEVAARGHKEDKLSGENATCTEWGLTEGKKCTSCGTVTVAQTEIAPLGHRYNATVTAPTCTEAGYTVYTCVCGDTYKGDEVAAAGHKEETVHGIAATCTEKGISDGKKCSVCGTVTVGQTEIAPLGHSYTSTVTPPTCNEAGYSIYTCVCGDAYTADEVAALGHREETIPGKSATCTEKGLTEGKKCSSCGTVILTQTEIAPIGHKYTVTVTLPTCTVDGYSTFTCACGDTYTGDEVAASGHVEKIIPAKAPTCTEKGLTEGKICFTCGTVTVAQTDIAPIAHSYTATVTAPTCTEAGYTTYTCSCGNTYKDDEVAAVGHSYTTAVTAPTCTEAGYTIYTCACGDTYKGDEVAALGHNDEETIPGTAPTCTLKGLSDGKKCSVCGTVTVGQTEIDPLGHNHIGVVTAPTCTSAGYTTYTCACGDVYTGDDVAALGHSYNAVVTEPTCTTAGYTTYTCACGESYAGDGVAALGHSYNAVITEPTCTSEGYTTYTCVCGDSYVGNGVAALDHIYNAVITEPTCTEGGYTVYTCACGDTYTGGEVEALGHRYNAVVTEPTCTEGGYTTYTCTCGDSYVADEVSPKGHTGSEPTRENEILPTCGAPGSYVYVVNCSTCGAEIVRENIIVPATGEHNYSIEIEKVDPRCTEDGYAVYACVCGLTETRYTAPTGHNHIPIVIEPTCTDYGCTRYSCACGDSYEQDIVSALGHAMLDEIEAAVEATCTTDGKTALIKCQRCEYIEGGEVIFALGHSYESIYTDPTCTENGYVTRVCHCGDSYVDSVSPATGHQYIADVTVSTCTASGYTTYTCHCGDTYVSDEVPPLGHGYSEKVTAPTCTKEGYTTYTCHCGYSYVSNYTAATGHKYSEIVKYPTCVEPGYTTYVCSCGDTYTVAGEAPLGHNWMDATCTTPQTCRVCGITDGEVYGHNYSEYVVAPTCTADGYTVYTCHCGDTYTADEITALGHTKVIDEAIDPTCTEHGYTEGEHCSTCNEVFIYQTFIPMLDHIYDEWTVINEPTCTENGLNHMICPRCDETIRTNVIAPNGHSYGEWIIDNNATCTDDGAQHRDCRVCGETEAKRIGSLGHVMGEWVTITERTCTQNGERHQLCSRCGVTVDIERTQATGHTRSDWIVDKEPTCTENGDWHKECITCHVVMETTIAFKLGHKEGEWEIYEDATASEDGVKHQYCTVCGDLVYTGIIYAKGTPGLSYTVNEDGESCTITGYSNGPDEKVYVPEYLDGYQVTAIADRAFYGCDNIFEITIPKTVISIGQEIFNEASNLHTVYYNSTYSSADNRFFSPSHIKKVVFGGYYVPVEILKDCTNITEVVILSGASFIEAEAFCGCTGLESITIPASVRSVGSWYSGYPMGVFYNCNSLKNVYIEDVDKWATIVFDYIYCNPCSYGAQLYVNGEPLTDLVLSDEVPYIREYAFYNCSFIESVTIGNNATSVGHNAFEGCSGITSVILGEKIVTIEESAFKGCSGIKELTIPDATVSIERFAFTECTSLENVIFGKGVETIGDNVFMDCTSLENVTLPSGITCVSYGLFEGCTSLKNVILPNGIRNIGVNAFRGCKKLARVTIPDTVTDIYTCAFQGCRELISVTLGEQVTFIEDTAFNDCYKLLEVINKSSLTLVKGNSDYGRIAQYALDIHSGESRIDMVDDYLFYTYEGVNYLIGYVGDDIDLTLPENYNGEPYEIYKNAFYYNDKITSVIIPDAVTAVGDSAFYYCSGLTSLTLGNGLTSIGNHAFECCSSLTDVTLGDKVTSVGDYAFKHCNGLISLTLGNGLTSIGNYTFAYCSQLTEVTLGDKIVYIGDYAFAGCRGFTSIVIPDSVEKIGTYAFSHCANATSIIIGNGVTSIGIHAFSYCSNLTSIVIGSSVEAVESAAFYELPKIEKVFYNGTVYQWIDIAFYGENNAVSDAARYYYSEEAPTDEGNYWHYVDGVPTVW